MFIHICLHLDDVIITWESTNRAHFVAKSFFFDFRLHYQSLEQWITNVSAR